MPLSRSRDYLSIGEVLEHLQGDFPDISISKIRFLEAEGLIQPERTASGYRKFFESDVSRLRYILTLQKEHFLPLKVIRERLGEVDSNGGAYPEAAVPPASPAAPRQPARAEAVATTGVALDRSELLKMADLTPDELAGLEEFGLVETGDGGLYDEGAVTAARAAKKMLRYGIEPRHLRMYKQFADRESSLFAQVVAPLVRRGERAAGETAESMRDLESASQQLHYAMLRSILRELG